LLQYQGDTMTTIGPGSLGALNLVGSLAGAQRRDADVDRAKSESAERKFQIDQKAMSAHSLGDLAETELSSERDADGRLPYSEPQTRNGQGGESAEHDSRSPQRRRSQDASGETGRLLDLEA
jgi:hypothetical protein